MTIAEARRLLQCRSNYALARVLGITDAAVSHWGRMVPPKRREQVRAILEKRKAEPKGELTLEPTPEQPPTSDVA